ncbi:hypothetical protein RR48_04753 [Papilio machaon]|uniref:Uncharacterized protein n=1 Tax=Papilio machaon TaxID=76193 RepID=A0A0N1IJ01_PAPMA|nr:hypothetical protein RR48_04753 [Papilio machaon]
MAAVPWQLVAVARVRSVARVETNWRRRRARLASRPGQVKVPAARLRHCSPSPQSLQGAAAAVRFMWICILNN